MSEFSFRDVVWLTESDEC